MSIGLKEVFKTLHVWVEKRRDAPDDTEPPSRPLSEESRNAIINLLEKHKLDEIDTNRLHEGLVDFYKHSIVPQRDSLAGFLHALQLLLPAIRNESYLWQWWDLAIKPVMVSVGFKRQELQHATSFVLKVLESGCSEVNETQSDISEQLLQSLLNIYLEKTRTSEIEDSSFSAEDGFVAQQIESPLVTFGCKQPVIFFVAIDKLLLRRQNRLQALELLCSFVRLQPPHLYKVRQTPLVEHLLKCLMIDTSTTVVSLALTILIMFLPHIPSSVKAHLPRLFLIYGRILCWEQQGSSTSDFGREEKPLDKEGSELELSETPQVIDHWEKLDSSFEATESSAPELLQFFTFLYGLYPISFCAYIHKPKKYLKRINFPRADQFDLDQNTIRKRSERYRRIHLLHPNFFSTTLDDELSDDKWWTVDPANVISDCMSLCLAGQDVLEEPGTPLIGNSDVSDALRPTKDIPTQSLGVSLLQATHLRRVQGSLPLSTVSSPLTRAQDVDEIDPATPIGVLSPEDSPMTQSPHLEPVTGPQIAKSPALRPAPAVEANLAFLQREIVLLKSDLNFERYLKRQHLLHIGHLQQRNIKEATVEAEALNLLNTNRVLKAQLIKASDTNAALKRETQMGRNQARKWETDLTSKLSALKEAEKDWILTEAALRITVKRLTSDADNLRQLVVDSESKALLANQELSFAEAKLQRLDELQQRIRVLEDTLKSYKSRELEFDKANDRMELLKEQLATANALADNSDIIAVRTANAFDRRLQVLEAKLREAENPMSGGTGKTFSPQLQNIIDSAVGASEAKFARLQAEHIELQDKHSELGVRHLELQAFADDSAIPQSSSLSKTLTQSFAVYEDAGAAALASMPRSQPMLMPKRQPQSSQSSQFQSQSRSRRLRGSANSSTSSSPQREGFDGLEYASSAPVTGLRSGRMSPNASRAGMLRHDSAASSKTPDLGAELSSGTSSKAKKKTGFGGFLGR